ncbi:hypothetical protein OG559_28135 [Micromonospora sp. NBC_01405]|uniref:hypothetical protein n=1 Tax=Micromonospora sp. NBC_01405 TaxID=2903589 RepID=UPI003246DA5F
MAGPPARREPATAVSAPRRDPRAPDPPGASHGNVHGSGDQAALSDADHLVRHYYADTGAALLGINRLGCDAAGWPYVQ